AWLDDICGVYYFVAATCKRGSHICKIWDMSNRGPYAVRSSDLEPCRASDPLAATRLVALATNSHPAKCPPSALVRQIGRVTPQDVARQGRDRVRGLQAARWDMSTEHSRIASVGLPIPPTFEHLLQITIWYARGLDFGAVIECNVLCCRPAGRPRAAAAAGI